MVQINKLAVGIATALALGYGTNAFAAIPAIGAIADSHLNVTNFSLRAGNGAVGTTGTLLDFGVGDPSKPVNVTANNAFATTSVALSGFATPAPVIFNSAALGFSFAINSALGVGYTPATLLAEATRLTGNPAATFAGSSSTSTGNALTPDPDIVHVDSQVSLLGGPLTGTSTARQGNNTDFTVTLAVPVTFELSFNADGFLRAALGQLGVTAQSAFNWVTDVTDSSNNLILSWKPNGVAGGLTGSCVAAGTCTEFADAFDMNRSLATSSVLDKVSTFASGAFEVELILAAGDYNFSIDHKTSADASTPAAIPEPTTLALLGLGLVGAAVSRRRKR